MNQNYKKDFFFIQMMVVPIIILIIAVSFITFTRSTNESLMIFKASHVMADYVFFNTLHIPLPFLLVFMVPDFRRWSKLKGISGPFSFWMNSLIIFIIIFSVLFLGSGIIKQFAFSEGLFYIALYLRLFLIGFHSAGQSMGISLLFNRHFQVEKSMDSQILSKIRTSEKILIWALVLLMLFAGTIGFRGFQDIRDNLNIDILRSAFFYLVSFVVVILVLYPLFLTKEVRWMKFFFHLRFLFYILDFFTPLSLIGHWCSHGTEYLYITKNILNKNSVELRKRFWKLFWIVGGVWGIFVFARTIEYQDLKGNWLHFYLSISWAGDLTHYWADRVIYRMKNQETRELIAPSLA